eukprot:TRINITY_DN6222_c0_g1_i2.p1 TRINITY_DN6222_c0_g1~~TRINITY_DN6222_c0_g1_i2.p1  ORF type:complete len:100 (-),score=5.48 TRINITY_DN6222_c0_g1_i2:191-490(-)
MCADAWVHNHLCAGELVLPCACMHVVKTRWHQNDSNLAKLRELCDRHCVARWCRMEQKVAAVVATAQHRGAADIWNKVAKLEYAISNFLGWLCVRIALI